MMNACCMTMSCHSMLQDCIGLVVCRYAVLGHEPGGMLLLALAQQALLQLDSFSPQELTNMVSTATVRKETGACL